MNLIRYLPVPVDDSFFITKRNKYTSMVGRNHSGERQIECMIQPGRDEVGQREREREVIVQRSKINLRIDQRSAKNTLNARLLKDINGFSGETRTTSYILKENSMK